MPAYIPEFEHDLFVSYGCVDDQPGDTGEAGWVTCFVDDLRKRLSERLGRKDIFSIWRDEERLERHVDLTRQIAVAVERSACMLVVLSPGYLASDWCQQERNDFLKWVRDRNASGSRVFVVERDWIEGDKPEEFRNTLGFKLWTGDPLSKNNLPRPLDKTRQSDRHEYNDRLNALAIALEAEFRRLKEAPERKVQGPAQPSFGAVTTAATVFLAEVTDDLRPQWKKVRSELDQRGVHVVSGGAPSDISTLENAVRQALEGSDLFVQLLSQFPGQPLPGDSNETYPLLQHRLAVEAQTKILQWRSPSLTEELFDEQEAEDAELAASHRRLVFGQVRAEHIEDFKRHLITEAMKPRSSEEPATGAGMVFVSFNPDSEDLEFADDLCGYLEQHGYGVVTPVAAEDADPDVIRADFEQNVLNSRGWIVVYGERDQKFWVRGQLNEINQLLCQQEKREGAVHLCAAPPAPKEVQNPLKLVGMRLPRMTVIDCQDGFEVEKLFPLMDSLSASADGDVDTIASSAVAGR